MINATTAVRGDATPAILSAITLEAPVCSTATTSIVACEPPLVACSTRSHCMAQCVLSLDMVFVDARADTQPLDCSNPLATGSACRTQWAEMRRVMTAEVPEEANKPVSPSDMSSSPTSMVQVSTTLSMSGPVRGTVVPYTDCRMSRDRSGSPG
jgi:hypothetical protein